MSNTLATYLACVQSTLEAALCLRDHPSQIVERHNKPEIEVGLSKELILKPIIIKRNEQEMTLIETSINSMRVSISLKIADELELIIGDKFSHFLMRRAEAFEIFRRKVVEIDVPGREDEAYNISFLITYDHYSSMWKHKVIFFIMNFMEEIDKEISSLKIAITNRCILASQLYLEKFTEGHKKR